MDSSLPLLVIVSGAPAVGKTTLARRLATELRLPLIAKDTIKERLGDALGAADREASKRLGAATYHLLYAFAGWLLDAGAGCLLESNFWRDLSEPELRPLVARAHAVLIHCETSPEEIFRRHAERIARGGRHPVHFDREEGPSIEAALRAGRFDPLDLAVPTLRVNTTSGYDPPLITIEQFIRCRTE